MPKMPIAILSGLELQNYFPMSKGFESTRLMKESVSSQLAEQHHVLIPSASHGNPSQHLWLNSNAWAIIHNSFALLRANTFQRAFLCYRWVVELKQYPICDGVYHNKPE